MKKRLFLLALLLLMSLYVTACNQAASFGKYNSTKPLNIIYVENVNGADKPIVGKDIWVGCWDATKRWTPRAGQFDS